MNEIANCTIKEINNLHSEIITGIRATLHKAVELGGRLKEVKEILPHADFTSWMESNIQI